MRHLMSALTLVVIATVPTTLQAQLACAARETVVERLEAKYGETFAGGGMQNASRVFEVWSSQEDGTWTILMTRSDGITCVMASGTDWYEGAKIPVKKGLPG